MFGRRNNDIFPILYGHPLPPQQIDELSDRKEAIFREMDARRCRPAAGRARVAAGVEAAGFHLAIGTSTPRANVELILDELDFAAYFAAIVSAEDVTNGKPDPQVFLLAAERLGMPPAHCVVVEDAVAGVQAALQRRHESAGSDHQPLPRALHEATRVVDSLAEVTPEDFLAML